MTSHEQDRQAADDKAWEDAQRQARGIRYALWGLVTVWVFAVAIYSTNTVEHTRNYTEFIVLASAFAIVARVRAVRKARKS